jgi:hypothetical protein
MPVTPTDLREIHGSVFVTETPDGLIVPWRPLSFGEFLEYEAAFKGGLIAPASLEDEIWKKCVTDPILQKNIALQKAGTVTTVVRSIMENSGPQSINNFNDVLNYYRGIALQPVHAVATVICRAFPGYTPDDIYDMDFHKMSLRLAQAEAKLMALGLMQEPIIFMSPEEEQEGPKERPQIKVDPKKLKEAFDLQETQPMHKRIEKAKAQGKKKLDLSKEMEEEDIDLGSTTNGEEFVVSTGMMMAGLELGDENEGRQLKRDAKELYPDYLKMGNKVKIKSVEERIQEAHARMEANKKKNLAKRKKK